MIQEYGKPLIERMTLMYQLMVMVLYQVKQSLGTFLRKC